MKLSNGPRLDERSTSSRAAVLALMLSAFSACDSRQKDSPQPQATTSASTSAVASASAAPASSSQKAPLQPIANPVICVNGRLEGWRRDHIYPKIQNAYESAGARVVRVNDRNFEDKKESCNGVMLVGGGDIDTTKIPQKERVHHTAKLISAQRQALDKRIAEWADENQVPALGECLGAQEIAVWEGAKFIQDIPSEVSGSINHREWHFVDLESKASVFGLGSRVWVKSNHHQAVDPDLLPDTLEVVGRSSDGLIEAIISKDGRRWLIQWHPQPGPGEKIYKNFVKMVAEKGYRSEK